MVTVSNPVNDRLHKSESLTGIIKQRRLARLWELESFGAKPLMDNLMSGEIAVRICLICPIARRTFTLKLSVYRN